MRSLMPPGHPGANPLIKTKEVSMSFQIKSYADLYATADEQRQAELFTEVCSRLFYAQAACQESVAVLNNCTAVVREQQEKIILLQQENNELYSHLNFSRDAAIYTGTKW